MTADREPAIWLDATTVYLSFRWAGRRPTGIPRVAAEILKIAHRDYLLGNMPRLVRYDIALPGFREVSWEDFHAVAARGDAPVGAVPSPIDIAIRIARKVAKQIPGDGMRTLMRLRRILIDLAGTPGRLAHRPIPGFRPEGWRGLSRNGGFWHPFRAGDVWVNLGCWWHGRLPEAMAAIRTDGVDVRSLVLIHDCLPLIFPEFVLPEVATEWRDGVKPLLAGTSAFLCYSENTRGDLRALLRDEGGYGTDIGRIRLGDQFINASQSEDESAAIRSRLGLQEPYVLLVGTIEARKNHGLAFRAWRTLLRRRSHQLPTLVFAGRWGWKTQDLRDQIKDSNGLDGRVLVLNNLSDQEMAAAYRGALFTLSPSLYEGWGLPVRESHAYGKICVAARNSSITEAGGDLAIYFDNDCQESLVQAIEALLAGPELRRAHEARIGATFTPVTWTDSWRDLCVEIDRTAAAAISSEGHSSRFPDRAAMTRSGELAGWSTGL